MIDLTFLLTEREGLPCHLSDLKVDPCPNDVSPNGDIAYIIHPRSERGRYLHAQVTGHWENFRLFCSKECADRARKSWDKASKANVDAHIAKITKLVEEYRKECANK